MEIFDLCAASLYSAYQAVSSSFIRSLSFIFQHVTAFKTKTYSLLKSCISVLHAPLGETDQKTTSVAAKTLPKKLTQEELLEKLIIQHFKTYPQKETWNVCVNGAYWGERFFPAPIIHTLRKKLEKEGFQVAFFTDEEDCRSYLKITRPQTSDVQGPFLKILLEEYTRFIHSEASRIIAEIQEIDPSKWEFFTIKATSYTPNTQEVSEQALQLAYQHLTHTYDIQRVSFPEKQTAAWKVQRRPIVLSLKEEE